jgi:hypothetical protein
MGVDEKADGIGRKEDQVALRCIVVRFRIEGGGHRYSWKFLEQFHIRGLLREIGNVLAIDEMMITSALTHISPCDFFG